MFVEWVFFAESPLQKEVFDWKRLKVKVEGFLFLTEKN